MKEDIKENRLNFFKEPVIIVEIKNKVIWNKQKTPMND